MSKQRPIVEMTPDELRQEVVVLREKCRHLERAADMEGNTIEVRSLVSHRDHRPLVSLQWGSRIAQLEAQQARNHAFAVLECLNASVSDAAVFGLLVEKVGLAEEAAAAMLLDLRDYRVRWDGVSPDAA